MIARRLAAAVLVAALFVAGCGPDTSGSTGPGGTSGPADTGTPVDTGGPNDTDSPTAQVTIDPALLAILPREVDGIAVIESPEGDSDALADDVLPTIATAAVGAVAVDAQAQDLAYALVVKLRKDAFNDGVFRDWRDSYDAGACAGESEVVGNASATVKGNTVYIGTCSSGLRTYHVWLKDKDILISVSSTGDKRLGLVMLNNLREP